MTIRDTICRVPGRALDKYLFSAVTVYLGEPPSVTILGTLIPLGIWQKLQGVHFFGLPRWHYWVKNLPAKAGDIRNVGLIPASGRYPGVGNGNSSILAWRIPLTEEPGQLQSVGLHRVRHNRSDLARTPAHFCPWTHLSKSHAYTNMPAFSVSHWLKAVINSTLNNPSIRYRRDKGFLWEQQSHLDKVRMLLGF